MPHVMQNDKFFSPLSQLFLILQVDCALFLDILVCAQHRSIRPDGTNPNEIDVKKIDEVIRHDCNRTVFYASPLLQPSALSRAWCLYEIMKTVVYGKELLVGLSESDREGLRVVCQGSP